MKKELKLLINKRSAELSLSKKTFEDIFLIMFSDSDLPFSEINDGYRIVKHTYGQIKERIYETSAALYEKIGAGHGFVGLEMENSDDFVVAFWAILRSGNKPYLVNTRHPSELSNGIIKTLKIEYIVSSCEGNLDAKYITADTLKSDKAFDGEFENEIAISTSATSLSEVVCLYKGEAVANQILNAKKILSECKRMALHYKGALKQLAFLPFYHIFGLFAVYFWFAFYGRTFVFLRDYSPQTILKTCRKHEVTHIFAVPLLWHTIEKQLLREVSDKSEKEQKAFYRGLALCTKLQNAFPYLGARASRHIMHQVTDKLFGTSIQFCISGGSYINDSALKLFNGIGYPLHNGYGMSEIGITSVELRKRPADRNKNSIGLPFLSVKYKISDENTLLVGGDTRCYAIIKDGVKTEIGEWLDTLDIAETDDGGNYFIKGRASDIVIGENGENINPDIIEKSFRLPSCIALSVLGIGDKGDEKLSLVVQINKYLSNEKAVQIKNAAYEINNSLPPSSRVSEFYFTYDAIMSETAIKVGRKYLLNAVKNGNVKLTPFSSFESDNRCGDFDGNSPLATRVREIVSEILGTEIKAEDCEKNLMNDFGISSLQYFSVLTALSEEFGVSNYSEKEQYRYTVREFCEFLERYI